MSNYRLTQKGWKRKLQNSGFRVTEQGGAAPPAMISGFLLTHGLGGDFMITRGFGASEAIVTVFPFDGGSRSVIIASASTLFGFADPHRTRPITIEVPVVVDPPVPGEAAKRSTQSGFVRLTQTGYGRLLQTPTIPRAPDPDPLATYRKTQSGGRRKTQSGYGRLVESSA